MGEAQFILPLLMIACLALFLFSGLPVAVVLGGLGLAFGVIGIFIGDLTAMKLSIVIGRIWGGIAENLVLVAVPMFIFMGTMIEKSQLAHDLFDALSTLLRQVPGGLALATILIGTLLAATTGIIGASVVIMTLLALPAMLKRGYNMSLATGTIAASGTLGILIPPSIMLVIMADLINRSVGNLFLAVIIPGLILSGFYMVYVVLLCRFRPDVAPRFDDRLARPKVVSIWPMILRSLMPPLILIFLVLGSIIFGWATPTEAAGVGALGATAIALWRRKLTWKVLCEVVDRTAQLVAMVFFIFVGATAFTLVFRLLGGDAATTALVDALGLGPWGTLFAIMAITFLLGCFLDWIEIILIAVPVFLPIVLRLDFGDHVPTRDVAYWFATLLAINLQTSFLTPPLGFALFYLKGASPPEVSVQSIYLGVLPFVLLQLTGLAIVLVFPDVALWMPRVLLN